MKNKVVVVLAIFVLTSTLIFGNPFDPVKDLLNSVCSGVRSLLPPVALLMFFGSGVVYAGGQFVGAETRARANVWATNMLIGAIIALIIATVVPTAMSALDSNVNAQTC